MKTTANDMDMLFSFMKKAGVDYVVDTNPSADKLERIKKAIERKKQLFQKAIDKYTNAKNINFNA